MQDVNPITHLRTALDGRTLQYIAKEVGCSPQHIHAVLKGKKRPGPAVLDYLGLQKYIVYRRKAERA